MIVAAGILWALALALVAGARITVPDTIPARWLAVLVVAFLLQGIARGRLFGLVATQLAVVVWMASGVVIVLVLLRLRTRGAGILAVGTLCNLLVVGLNGAMPVTAPLEFTDRASRAIAASGGFYVSSDNGTMLAALGDVIPLAAFGSLQMLSCGDVLLVVGVLVLIWDSLATAEVKVPKVAGEL